MGPSRGRAANATAPTSWRRSCKPAGAGSLTRCAPPCHNRDGPPNGEPSVPEPLRHTPDRAVIAGFDFSTGAVKGLAFDLDGTTLAEVRLPTDLWTEGGVSELSLTQLEGQARSVVRLLAGRLRDLGRLDDWGAVGISAAPHTAWRVV